MKYILATLVSILMTISAVAADSSSAVSDTTKGTQVLVFTASWSAPSKMIGPEVEQLKKSDLMKGKTLQEIDIDQYPDIAEKYKLEALPTILVVKDGVVQGYPIVGVHKYDAVVDSLNQSFKYIADQPNQALNDSQTQLQPKAHSTLPSNNIPHTRIDAPKAQKALLQRAPDGCHCEQEEALKISN